MIGAGAIFLAHNFGFEFDIGRWWPVLLIALGLALLLDRVGTRGS